MPRPPQSPSPLARRPALAVAALVTALAAAVRFVGLDERGLWLDEAFSWLFASGPPAVVVEWLRQDSGPPLYYWLLAGWMRLAGDGEASLRALSALLGTALVAATYAAGARWLGRRAALTAALVLALLPIQVRYAQEARAYTLVALLGLIAMEALARWVEGGDGAGGGRRWLAVHAAAFLALLYTHNYGFFLLAAGVAYAAWRGWRRGRPWRALAGFPLVLAGYLPWLPVLREQLARRGPYAWMRLAWEEEGLSGSLGASLAALAPGGGAPAYVGLPGLPALGPLPALAAVALLVAGAAALLRRSGRRPEEARPALPWLGCYLLLPPAAAAGASMLFEPIYLPGRIDQLVVPAFALGVAAGLGALRPAALRLAAVAGWAALSAAGLAAFYRQAEPPAERGMAAAVLERLQPADAVLATARTRVPLTYYLRHRPDGVPLYVFPAELVRHPAGEEPDPAPRRAEAAELAARITAARPRRLYLAFVPNRDDALLLEALLADPRLRRAREIGVFHQRLLGQEVRLFEIPVGGAP